LIKPLVIEQDGAVVLLQFGFGRTCQIGNLHTRSLRDMAPIGSERGIPAFARCATP
jgi:hypothetical protein